MKTSGIRWLRRSGFSLVELMVSTLVIVIIFVGWLKIANFQAIRKESLRRAAIETAAGYLDVMVELGGLPNKTYRIEWIEESSAFEQEPLNGQDRDQVQPMYGESDPIGYHIKVTPSVAAGLAHDGAWIEGGGRWAVIRLYDKHGVSTNDAGRAFSTMSVKIQ